MDSSTFINLVVHHINYFYKVFLFLVSRVATLPGNLEKPRIFNNFYMFSSKISTWHKNSIVKI